MPFHTEDAPRPSDTQTDRCCPKTGRPLKPKARRPWLLWLLPITGLVALIWFLVRVVPKPSRALYPCQRVAMPLASGFVAWLLGIAASIAAFRKAKASLAGRRYAIALIALTISVGAIWVALSATSEKPALAEIDPLAPIGEAKGIHPGRAMAWLRNRPCGRSNSRACSKYTRIFASPTCSNMPTLTSLSNGSSGATSR